MQILKRIAAAVIIAISLVGTALCIAGVMASWSLNTPLTDALTRSLSGVEQFLTMTDSGLERINDNLAGAQTAVDSLEKTALTAGDVLTETNIAYQILDRTVGDELFPKIITAQNIAVSLRDSVVAFNATLEAVNEVPFVEVPTISGELATISERLTAVQTSVQETKDDLRAVKEEAISKPVTAVTNRTPRISSDLEATQTAIAHTQTQLADDLTIVAATKARVPSVLDLVSVAITLIFLWLAFAQLGLALHAWRYFKEA